MQRQRHRLFAPAPTGKQQKLTGDPLQRIEVGFGLGASRFNGQPQSQSGDRALEVMGNARQHRRPLLLAAGQPLQHGVEATAQPLHFTGPLLGEGSRALLETHPAQGPLQPPQGTLHLEQQEEGPGQHAAAEQRQRSQQRIRWPAVHIRQWREQPDLVKGTEQLDPHTSVRPAGG